MPVCRTFLLLGFVLTALAGCAERGSIRPVPPDAPKAATVEVFAATNRKALTVGPETGRSENIRHFRLLARVPPDRKAGQLSLPKGRVNPKRDFLAEEFGEYRSGKAFVEAINRRLGALPASDRNVTLYVHGFNKTFAEGVMRLAQLDHDLGASGVPVHFSWPSAGLPVGYAHDRDSVLYSRDALEEVMRSMPTGRQRLLLVAHSMGAQLVMETLRQIEIATPGWGRRNLQGVILISPDIDVDLFRAQAARIGKLPQPFVIFTSSKDRALGLSAIATGRTSRLGNILDPKDIAELEVTLLDVTSFSSGIGHFNVGTSAGLLRVLSQVGQFDEAFSNEGKGQTGLVQGTVLMVQNVTNIVLSPLSGGLP